MVDEEKPKERTLIDILKDIRKDYSEELLCILFSVTPVTFKKWISGKATPNDLQRKLLASILEVHELLSYLPVIDEKMWWVTFDDFYLYGIPAEEVRMRPNDVRISALITRSKNEGM